MPRRKKRPARAEARAARHRSVNFREFFGGSLAVVFLVGTVYWVGFGYWQHIRDRDDPIHAAEVFDGRVDYVRILASQRWHSRDAEPWDCTFAIVELRSSGPDTPPPAVNGRAWWLGFDGDWQATPEHPGPRDTMRRALQFCRKYWDDETGNRLARALATPGSWYIRSPVGETLLIYSRPERIAARIRFGD